MKTLQHLLLVALLSACSFSSGPMVGLESPDAEMPEDGMSDVEDVYVIEGLAGSMGAEDSGMAVTPRRDSGTADPMDSGTMEPEDSGTMDPVDSGGAEYMDADCLVENTLAIGNDVMFADGEDAALPECVRTTVSGVINIIAARLGPDSDLRASLFIYPGITGPGTYNATYVVATMEIIGGNPIRGGDFADRVEGATTTTLVLDEVGFNPGDRVSGIVRMDEAHNPYSISADTAMVFDVVLE